MSLINSNSGGPLSAGGLLTPTPVKTSAYTANPGDFVPVDTTSGAVTVTLPAAPADQSMVGVKMVKQGSTNAVTISCGGADTINTAGGSTSGTLAVLKQGVLLQYSAAIAVWYVLDDSLPAGTMAATAFSGIISANAGTNSSGSAPILTALGAVSGSAIQLTDTTRDYMVYLTVTTAGTATSVTIGHTSSANDVTLMASAPATAGQVISFRLPAGWYFKWTGTTTAIANQVAVGC
jgi:hypothetical protein